jgi:hypothetical protein
MLDPFGSVSNFHKTLRLKREIQTGGHTLPQLPRGKLDVRVEIYRAGSADFLNLKQAQPPPMLLCE